LLKEGKLTKDDLVFGERVAQEVQDIYVDNLVQMWEAGGVEFRDRSSGVFMEAAAETKARATIEKHYPKGWMPVVKAPFSEGLSQGKVRTALEALWQDNKNIDNLFDQDYSKEAELNPHKVANAYMGELSYKVSGSSVGGDGRLARMGLRVFEGRTIVDDTVKNAASTQNIESVLTYLKLASTRKRIHEQYTLPVTNATKSVMMTMNADQGQDQSNNLAWHKMYLNRMVYGGSAGQADSNLVLFGKNVTPLINVGISATSLLGVALSWKVAVVSGLANNIGMLATAISNDVAGDGLFGRKELAQAWSMMRSRANQKKMGALLDYYQVSENQETNMAGDYRRNSKRKLFFSGHIMNIMNFWTDHNSRGLVMVAQMLKDGNWEAHSVNADGEVVYDVKKDRQFYKANGEYTENGEVMLRNLRQRLMEDGIHGQTETGPTKAAYDIQSQGVLKWLSDKYVIGGMDRSQHAGMDRLWYGRMFSTFRKFMITRIGHWYVSPTDVEKGGKWVVGVDPVTGEKVEQWEKREITSYIYALASAYTRVKEAASMGWGDAHKLSTADKRSLSRLAVDVSMWASLFAIYALLVPDDEERAEMRKGRTLAERSRSAFHNRFVAIFGDMAADQFAGSPWYLAKAFSGYEGNPVPALGTAKTMMEMVTDPSKILDLVPGKTTARDLYDLYERSSDTPE